MKKIKTLYFSIFFIQIIALINNYIKKEFIIIKYKSINKKKIYLEKKRPTIIDRNEKILAKSKKSISAYFLKNSISEKTLNFIKKNYPNKILDFENKSNFIFLSRNISDKEIKEIKKNKINDIKFIPEYERINIFDELSHIIGNTDIDSNGISGIEKLIEINENFKKEKNIKLTIDSDLSLIITDLLKKHVEENNSESAMAIIIDSKNGDIISFCQYPFYIKNKNDIKYLNPISITNLYEFGSVIKAFCMLAGYAENIVNPNDLIDCKNSKTAKVNGRIVNTWKACGIIPFSEVIKNSNNIGISQISVKLNEKLYDHYCKLGFNKKSGIEIPGEISAYLTHPSNWSKQSIISLSFGYEIMINLLNLAKAWSVFSNNGKIMNPKIIYSNKIIESEKLYSYETIEKSLFSLKYSKSQVPKEYQFLLDNFDIFLKTGTARVLENGNYIENKNIYTTVGHIKNNNESKIIALNIRYSSKPNSYASSVALPIFMDIIKIINLRDYKN